MAEQQKKCTVCGSTLKVDLVLPAHYLCKACWDLSDSPGCPSPRHRIRVAVIYRGGPDIDMSWVHAFDAYLREAGGDPVRANQIAMRYVRDNSTDPNTRRAAENWLKRNGGAQ